MLYKLQFLLQRQRYAAAATRSPIAGLYQQRPADTGTSVDRVRFLVVDCEMSGLDARKHQLLSMGWVSIECLRVVNASGHHVLIYSEQDTGDSSVIHGLSDSRLAGASSAASALITLSKQVPDSILVFHHAPLDLQFMQQAARRYFRCPLLFSYIDTMEIEQQRYRNQQTNPGFRLAQCRERYGLPNSPQHNALADARATAELLLAQLQYLSGQGGTQLGELPLHCSIKLI